MTTRNQRIADALRAYYRSEHSAPITLMHAADLIEQLQRDLDNAQAGKSIAQLAAPRAQEPDCDELEMKLTRCVDALKACAAYIATQEIWHSDKFRESWCYSRFGDDDAQVAARHGIAAYKMVRDVIAYAGKTAAPQLSDSHEQTAAAMAADNCELWRNECEALRAEVKQLHADLEASVGMLAAWCVAVDVGGSGWDCWDDHYKAAMYQPGPLRERLDAAIAAERSAGAESGAA